MKRRTVATVVAMMIVLVMACTKKTKTPASGFKTSASDMPVYAFDPYGADSPFIHVDSANRMLSSYLNSLNSSDPVPELHSLIIDAEALRMYLSNTAIKNVKIMLAHRLSYINNGGLDEPAGLRSDAITIVIAGFDENSNYVYTPAGTALDNAKPCPYNCPTVGTAASDLLQ